MRRSFHLLFSHSHIYLIIIRCAHVKDSMTAEITRFGRKALLRAYDIEELYHFSQSFITQRTNLPEINCLYFRIWLRKSLCTCAFCEKQRRAFKCVPGEIIMCFRRISIGRARVNNNNPSAIWRVWMNRGRCIKLDAFMHLCRGRSLSSWCAPTCNAHNEMWIRTMLNLHDVVDDLRKV